MAREGVGRRGRRSLSGDGATPGREDGTLAAGRLRAFLNDPDLDVGAASRVLRGAFLSFFAGQAVVATLVAATIAVAAGVRPRPTPWVGATAVGASLAQLLLGLAVATTAVRAAGVAARALARERAAEEARTAAREGAAARTEDAAPADGARGLAERLRAARSSALWATVMAAVLLSTPSWFAAFAWLSGNRGTALLGVLALLGMGYAFGFLQLGALARGIGTDAARRRGDRAPAPDADASGAPGRRDAPRGRRGR